MDNSAAWITCIVGVTTTLVIIVKGLSRPKKSPNAPASGEKMKRLMLTKPNEDMNKVEITLETVDIPQPRHGQVLVKMSAAVVNPSDYMDWKNVPKDLSKLPKHLGHEGSGVVVASGGGLIGRRLVGRTVGVVSDTTSKGTYAEYICVNAVAGAVNLGDKVQPQDGAAFFINPFTLVGILDTAASNKSRALIHTAAASQLGQMMVQLAPTMDMTVINVVRREEQVKLLKDLGAEYVVSQADDNWQSRLSELVKQLNIKVAFDAVGGKMTGTLVSVLPKEGTCFVYGTLASEEFGGIVPVDLFCRLKRVTGFRLNAWLKAGGLVKALPRLSKTTALVTKGLEADGGWCASQFKDCALEDMHMEFLKLYNTVGFTGSTLRIRMDN